MRFERLKECVLSALPYIQITIILIMGIASYANSFDVPLQLDDRATIRASISLNADLFSIQYFIHRARWFADLTFALNRQLHGEEVFGYHLLNLIIHLASACMVYLLVIRAIEALKQTFGMYDNDDRYLFLLHFIPCATAIAFVCHPVQTQAVTYISQRYTTLATFFYISSLCAYLQARISSTSNDKSISPWSWGAASILSALLAMKCKEIAFTLPLMAMVMEILLFRGQWLKNSRFLIVATGLLLIIPLQLIYIQVAANPESMLGNLHTATSETQIISRADYLLTQFRVIATYLRLLILPINQNWDYDYPVYHTLFDLPVIAGLMLHVSFSVLAILLFVRSQKELTSGNRQTGISMRMASLGILWFYLAICVESSLIPIRDVIFEHRVYLPSVGFFMAISAGISTMAAYTRRIRISVWCGFSAISLIIATGTINRNMVWADEMILWQDVLKKSPNKARANMAVGTLYVRKFMPEKSLPYFVKTVELEPGRDFNWISLSSAICLIAENEERCTDGLKYLSTVETVAPAYRKQWLAASSNNLGLTYEYLGNLKSAQESYRKAVTIDPSLALAWYNMALASIRQNDKTAAADALTHLRTINPQLAQKAVKITGE